MYYSRRSSQDLPDKFLECLRYLQSLSKSFESQSRSSKLRRGLSMLRNCEIGAAREDAEEKEADRCNKRRRERFSRKSTINEVARFLAKSFGITTSKFPQAGISVCKRLASNEQLACFTMIRLHNFLRSSVSSLRASQQPTISQIWQPRSSPRRDPRSLAVRLCIPPARSRMPFEN